MNKKRPVVTWVIIGICLIINLLITFSSLENKTEAAILFGAYYKPFILAGEWWRFLSVGFVHVSYIHLFVNCFSCLSLGQALENRMGKKSYLLIFLISVIGGSLFLFAAEGNTVAVGLSGGLYGLMAAYTFFIIQAGGWNHPMIRASLIRAYAINIMINFMPNVSVSAHIGGYVSGLLVTMLLFGAKQRRRHCALAIALFLFFTGITAYRNTGIPADQEYFASDARILNKVKNIGLESYAYHIAERLDTIYHENGKVTYLLQLEDE